MRKFVVAICLLAILFVCGGAGASTIVDIGSTNFVVPQDGILGLSGPLAEPVEGTFRLSAARPFQDPALPF